MKIICIGRNYADHVKELDNAKPTDPVIFLKPDTAILLKKQPFFIPEFSSDVHHEVELLVRINRIGKHIDKKFAYKYYDEIGLGISKYFTLKIGDVIFTGTPAGVGSVKADDVLTGYIGKTEMFSIKVK